MGSQSKGETPKTNLSKLLTLQKIVLHLIIDFIDKIENAVIFL